MSQKSFALGKTNLIICAVAVLLIVVGFVLMADPAPPLRVALNRISLAPDGLSGTRRLPGRFRPDGGRHPVPLERENGRAGEIGETGEITLRHPFKLF